MDDPRVSFLEAVRAHYGDNTPPPAPAAPTGPIDAGDITAYVQTVCDNLAGTTEGSRNDALNRAAYTLGRLTAAGQLDYHTAADALTGAAKEAGLDDTEIGPTLRSGLAAGEKDPRALEARETPTWPVSSVLSPVTVGGSTTAGTGAPDAAAGVEPPPERTSWWPLPIGTVVAERAEQPDPTHLARTDGHRLFYSGKVNGLLGESESGKTCVALHAVHQALTVGETCLYLDFEDSAKGIDSRLRLLGATNTHLNQLHYANPDEALGLAQHADLAQALHDTPYTLVIVDGVNAAMTLLGLDVDSSNKDATTFTQRILRPLANTGAAIVTIDHVPKNKDARGKGGIGAQAKRAMTRGCALRVEVVREFGPGMHGELKLTVDKDTPGKVRGVSAAARHAGVAHIDSTRDGHVTMRVVAPELREDGKFRPTHLMAKVSAWLETVPDGAAKSAIEDGVGGNREHVRTALDCLVDDGHVTRSTGPRGAILHTVINPFVEL